MKIECSFSGCSCGCTPSAYRTFEGEDPDIYIAIADWAQDYLANGTDKCRKLNIPKRSQEILITWDNFCNELRVIDSKKAALIKKEKVYEEASKTLGLEIPDEKKLEIKKDKTIIAEIDDKIKELEIKIKTLLTYSKVEIV
jgi:hypothetical protein